jgi:hypothetical protein
MYLGELKDCPYKQTFIDYSKNSLIRDFLNVSYVGKLTIRIPIENINKSENSQVSRTASFFCRR